MDAESDPNVIREDIEETRSALAEKLETLESQVRSTVEGVRETVEGAKETVQETIENVSSTVQDTIGSVQQTFDVNYQMQRRPWAMMCGSVAASSVTTASRVPASLSSARNSWIRASISARSPPARRTAMSGTVPLRAVARLSVRAPGGEPSVTGSQSTANSSPSAECPDEGVSSQKRCRWKGYVGSGTCFGGGPSPAMTAHQSTSSPWT